MLKFLLDDDMIKWTKVRNYTTHQREQHGNPLHDLIIAIKNGSMADANREIDQWY